MNSVIECILKRRSIRKYEKQQVEEEKLNQILECAKYAPSGKNRQTWHFTVVQNKNLIDEMAEDFRIVSNGNSRMSSKEYHVFYEAPTVIVVSAQDKQEYATADCASAVENILIAAESLGLGSCFICLAIKIFKPETMLEKYKEKLELPEGYTPIYCVSIGYPKEEGKVHPRKENIVNYIK